MTLNVVTEGTGMEEILRGDDTENGAMAAPLSGMGGGVLIFGFGGNDVISGGAGADTIAGRAGDDTLFGHTHEANAPDNPVEGEVDTAVFAGAAGWPPAASQTRQVGGSSRLHENRHDYQIR